MQPTVLLDLSVEKRAPVGRRTSPVSSPIVLVLVQYLMEVVSITEQRTEADPAQLISLHFTLPAAIPRLKPVKRLGHRE
jgi:hypothetical protein